MSRILGIDTTSEFGSLALVAGGETAAEVLLHSRDGFAHLLFAEIGKLLARAGCRLADVDGFAAAAGPGSFTGVRVGLAAAKGLAEALGRPAAAVSNLAAVASFGTAARRAAVLDARRGQVYGALYDGALQTVLPETVTRFPDWLGSLPHGDIEFVATDFSPFRAALAGSAFEHARVIEAPRALAAAIARLGAGRLQDPAALDANYVRVSDAELFWTEPRP